MSKSHPLKFGILTFHRTVKVTCFMELFFVLFVFPSHRFGFFLATDCGNEKTLT